MLVGLLLCVVSLAVVFLAWRLLTRKGRAAGVLSTFPGPPGLFENAAGLRRAGTDLTKLLEELLKILDAYPSPCRIFFFGLSFVLLYKPKHVEALLRGTTNLGKSRDYELVRPWLGDGLLLSRAAKWTHRRRQLTPAFHFAILKGFASTMRSEAEVLCGLLRERCGEVVDVADFISHCTLDIIATTAMGTRLGAQTGGGESYVKITGSLSKAISEFGEIVSWRSLRSWWWSDLLFFNFSEMGRRQKRSLRVLHDFTQRVILERAVKRSQGKLAKEDEGGKRPFLDLLLDLAAEEQLSMDEVREEVDTFMFEGHDTTATGLQWLIHLLGRHPEAQERAREEVLGAWDDSLGGVPTEALGSLGFLERCVKESQRLFPPVPIIVRRLDEDLRLDDQWTVPAGLAHHPPGCARLSKDDRQEPRCADLRTSVSVPLIRLHRDPELFADPLEFRPERFEAEETSGRHPFAFVPFSAGPRNCIGQRFALMEEKMVMCHLLRAFRWRSVDAEVKPASQMVLKPAGGVRVVLETIQ